MPANSPMNYPPPNAKFSQAVSLNATNTGFGLRPDLASSNSAGNLRNHAGDLGRADSQGVQGHVES